MPKRTCKKCKEEKELEEFSTSPECKLGYRYECKICRNKRVAKGPCKENPSWFKKGHKLLPGSEKGWFKKGNKPIGPEFLRGKKPYNYIDGKGTQRGVALRNSLKCVKLRKLRLIVLERDKFKCTECLMHNEMLHVHHIIPLIEDLSKAYDLDNLRTLCPKCHARIDTELRKKRKGLK